MPAEQVTAVVSASAAAKEKSGARGFNNRAATLAAGPKMFAKVRGTHPLLPIVALQKPNFYLRNSLHAQQEQTIQCRVKMLMFLVALLHLSHGRRVCWVSTSMSAR